MSRRELQWRTVAALRTAAQRVAMHASPSRWTNAEITRALVPGSPPHAAAQRGDRLAAHTAIREAFRADVPSFLIGSSLRRAIVKDIGHHVPHAATLARDRADRIVAGRFDLLGYRDLSFDPCGRGLPDWHFDPVHHRCAPPAFWADVPYLDPSCGDHKVIWELNRHQHLLVLGRAYWLTGEGRYRQTAIAHLLDWIAANPPLRGINWTSMLELAFRALSWMWALALFADEATEPEQPWMSDVVAALDRQLRHIEQNLSYYFSPNTHLLGEALALYVGGRSLPFLRRARHYADRGRTILVDEIARQIGADGGHLERSTHYHRYTLDFYLLALSVARVTDDPVAARFEAVVSRLAHAARLLSDDTGRIPHLGDDDGGMLLPMCGRAPDDLRDSLSIAAALTDQPELALGPVPEEALWMLSHPALADARLRLERRGTPAPISSAALPDTGYFISRSPGGSHLVFDAGPHGYANAGHAHSDALAVTLTVAGTPLLIDPGTACYTADPGLRDRFRSSALHNTLVIDGREQSTAAGPFHWRSMADARCDSWRTNAAFDYVVGHHEAWHPFDHHRHVFHLHDDVIVVVDVVSGTGSHEVLTSWHVDPSWLIYVDPQRALMLGSRRITWATSSGAADLTCGDEGERTGWYSPMYGRVEPSSTLRVREHATLPYRLVSVFSLDPENDIERVALAPDERYAPDRPIVAQLSRTQGTDVFALRSGVSGNDVGRAWSADGVETDAALLYIRTGTPSPSISIVDGSWARVHGVPTLQVHAEALMQTYHRSTTTERREAARAGCVEAR